MSVDQTPA